MKKLLSLVLVLAMLASMMVIPVGAVASDYSLVADTVVLDGTNPGTVEVKWITSAGGPFYTVQATWDVHESEAEYFTLTSLSSTSIGTNDAIVGAFTQDNNVETGAVYYSDSGFAGYYTLPAGAAVWTATYTVDPNTPADDYQIDLHIEVVTGGTSGTTDENDIDLQATITVEEAVSEPEENSDYEIYYTLDKADGSDGDHYHEYGIGDDVVATVKLKNNTANALTLQAYDIYLDYHAGLKYKEHNMTGAVALTANSNDEAATGEAVTHIEAVAEKYKNSDATKNLPANGELTLGTITFTIDSNNANVKYGTELNIGFELAADATNSANATGVTNFSVGSEATGDKVSYYPMATGDVKGAEVMTTYEVTYDDGVDDEIAVPAKGTKQYNNPLNLAFTGIGERTGYTFLGWSETKGATEATYTATGTATYTENKATTLYAVWQKDTVKITWMSDGKQYGEQNEIAYNTVPTAPTTSPSKDADAQYTYYFMGWNTNKDATEAMTLTAVTQDTTYYAIYSKTVNKYTVTWKNHDDTVLETDENIPYGTTPTYDGETPTKAQDETNTYTFAGWSPEISVVTGDATYTATFTSTARVYTVNFSDGTTAMTGGFNASITLPSTAAAKTGYTFSGWNTVENPTTENPGTPYASGASYTVTKDEILYAQYTPNKYTVIFNKNANDATGTMSDQEFTYDVTQKLTANGFTRTGWDFNGWNTQANGSGTTYNNEQEVSNLIATDNGTVNLYAQWTQASYDVNKGIVQNGSLTVDKEKANYNDTITVTVTPNAGYGIETVTYTPESGTAQTIDPVNGIYSFTMPDADVTVNAIFTAIDYTVTVTTPANGTVEASKTAQAHVGDTITLTVKPATGYKLKTLTYTKEGETTGTTITATDGKYEFTMPAANVTVAAEFEGISYTIKFDKNDEKADGTMSDLTAVYGQEYTPTNVFTKTGYTFKGWTTAANGTDIKTTVSNLTTTDGDTVTLYAQWTANTDTKYVVNHYQQNVGGNASDYTNGYTLKDTDNLTGTSDSKVTPEVKSYEGFESPSAEEITIAADGSTVVNYYYTRESYTITLNYNYEGQNAGSLTVTYGDKYTSLTDATRPGYTFNGWYDAQTGGNKVTAETTVTKAEDHTLYAQWTAIEYTITFNLNGGTLPTDWTWPSDVTFDTTKNELTYTIESTAALPALTHTNSLYTFKTWTASNVNGNWTATDYNAAETSLTGKYGDVTLTAQWNEVLTYEIQEYKYAGTNQMMLLIATENNTNAYTYDGQAMFYSDADGYKLSATVDGETVQRNVFVTLISSTDVQTVNGKVRLTTDGMGKLAQDSGEATAIRTTGDINNDNGVVNIADANIVYQMIVNGGGYYTNLEVADRLAADMAKETYDSGNHRATIDDVHTIINKINGTN